MRLAGRARATLASTSRPVAVTMRPVAVVVGAGVNGLTCAVRLLEAGWDVHCISRDRPEKTVSLGAGAIWEFPPYKVEPQEEAQRWVLATRDVFDALAPAVERTGVCIRRVHYLYRDNAAVPGDVERPHWLRAVRDYRGPHVPPECGSGFASGYSHVAPVVMMDVYLVWLERLATALGCTFHWGVTLPSLQGVTQVVPHASLIVNCCGLGAVSLVGDTAMTAVRGVLVLVRCPGVEGVYSDESWTGPELTYIVPKGNGIVACAGCAQPGATSTKVAPEEAQAVLRRCEALLPALAGAPMLSTWAGLRPVRDAVRLETAQLGDGMPVVHNYGHGGSGVVVSWGCAKVVATLAAAHAGGGLQPRDLRAVPQADGLPPLGCAPGVVSRL